MPQLGSCLLPGLHKTYLPYPKDAGKGIFYVKDPLARVGLWGRLCGASAYLHIEVAAERAQKVLAYLPYPLKNGLNLKLLLKP